MKYYIIAGEASGDLHGANLMKALYEKEPNAEIRFWGGDLMQSVGGTIVKHYRELAFMGFLEVILNLKTILSNIKICKKDIEAFQPDVLIFIDYPGFNIRIATWAKERNIPTHYYISPQIWAWKENRIKAIKRDVDFMYVILPFEKDFYEKKHNFPVHFVGHPLIDAIASRTEISDAQFRKDNELDDKPIIALLPGSRKQEINTLLPLMLQTALNFPNEKFIITGISGLKDLYPKSFPANITLVFDKTYETLQNAKAAIVCSGTATLETALFNVPQVVIYKTSWLNYQIGKRLAKVDFISLPNLIANQDIVTELIQNDCIKEKITIELNKLLISKNYQFYNALVEKVGESGASEKAAQLIFKLCNQ